MGKIFSNLEVKYKEYGKLSEDDKDFINELLKAVNPSEKLEGREPIKNNFWYLSWDQIEIIRAEIRDNSIEKVIEMIYNLQEYEIQEVKVISLISSFKWVVEQIEKIAEVEKHEAGESKATAKEIAAGIENFQKFSFYNSLHALTNGDPLKEDAVMQLPYWQIFRNLNMRSMKKEFETNLNK